MTLKDQKHTESPIYSMQVTSKDIRPWRGLQSDAMTAEHVASTLEGFFRTNIGAQFIVDSFTQGGFTLDPLQTIALEIEPINFGPSAGIAKITHNSDPERQIIVNVSLSSGERAAIVQQDYHLMQHIHTLLPHNTPAVYAAAMIPTSQGELAIYSEQAFSGYDELNWTGGIQTATGLVENIFIELNRASEGKGVSIVNAEDSLLILAEMMRINASVFMKSNESIILPVAINNGDFIYLDDSSTAEDPIRLITARANLLDKANYIYARQPNVDSVDRFFSAIDSLPADQKRRIFSQANATVGMIQNELQQALTAFTNFPTTLTPRQYFVLMQLLHIEAFAGREIPNQKKYQFWPPEAIIAGINSAIADEYSHLSTEEQTQRIKQWWHAGDQSVLSALEAFENFIKSPLIQITSMFGQVPSSMFNCKLLKERSETIRNILINL